jgi:hypothetical protein
MDEIRVPRLYWEDFVRLSKTRLWFGLKPDGFDIDGDTLRFAPGATRVYAASSDPLYPGKETKPNYQSAEFLGWWDRHYNALADFEPQFHRLNQIQKWGCIFVVLKEKKSSILDFLFTLPATRNFDFETWYKNTEGLTNRTTLPFLDREKYHRSTECFLLLRSKDYPLMGQRFFLSGGVSLASRSDILAKLKKSRSRDTTAGNTAPGQRKPGSEVRRLPKQGIAGDRGGAGTTSGPEEKKADPFGTISAEKRENTVKLQWNRGGIVLAEDFAEALVSRQENRVTGYKDERIFNGLSDVEKVVRLERGKRYLVRMKEMHDRWVYLKINDIAEKKEFPVQLAGTEPDSDIFFAKLVSDRQMETLRTGGTCEELVDPSIIPH